MVVQPSEVQPGEPSASRGLVEDEADALALTALTLSRRFAAGATLWCVAPEWPEHARHVAVEFVHPVIVGKRALPAVSVDGPSVVNAMRALVSRGDVVLMMSSAACSEARDVLRRARAWGATTIWLGVGPPPPDDRADHVVWVEHDSVGHDSDHQLDSSAVYDGRLVLRYHVLWELTHVCLEHSGMRLDSVAVGHESDGADVCITCSDEGRIGEVIDTDDSGAARVRTSRGVEIVDTSTIAAVASGDLLLIHAGTAIAEVP